jgi:hypothetical protein
MAAHSRLCSVLVLAAACGTARAPETHPMTEALPSTAASALAEPIAQAPARFKPLPIWFSPALGLHSIEDAEAKLDAKEALGFAALARDGQMRFPKTCREREALKAKGFEPETNLQAQSDAGAEIRCGTFHLLAHAQPARITFLPSTLDDSVLTVLPALVATATSQARASLRAAATSAGKSLRDFEPQARTMLNVHGEPVIVEQGNGTSINIELQARGDFDADGIEDMALSVRNSADQSNWAEMRLLVLTRMADAEMLTLLD